MAEALPKVRRSGGIAQHIHGIRFYGRNDPVEERSWQDLSTSRKPHGAFRPMSGVFLRVIRSRPISRLPVGKGIIMPMPPAAGFAAGFAALAVILRRPCASIYRDIRTKMLSPPNPGNSPLRKLSETTAAIDRHQRPGPARRGADIEGRASRHAGAPASCNESMFRKSAICAGSDDRASKGACAGADGFDHFLVLRTCASDRMLPICAPWLASSHSACS